MLNRLATFEEIFKNKMILFNLFEESSNSADNSFSELSLEVSIRDYLYATKLAGMDRERILEAFSINNLVKNSLATKDERNGTFSFASFIFEAINYLDDDKHYQLNNYNLKKFRDSIHNFNQEFKDFKSKNDFEITQFIYVLGIEFKNIRQELEKHIRTLESKVNKITTAIDNIENDVKVNKFQLSKDIMFINEHFIQPLIIFLSSKNKVSKKNDSQGVADSIRSIVRHLEDEKFIKNAQEINAFWINFQSYLSQALDMEKLLNRYIQKSSEDIMIYSNIEKLYSFLEEKVEEVSHGKKANKYLKSTNLDSVISYLDGIKTKENINGTIDYDDAIQSFDIESDRIKEEMNDLSGKKEKVKSYFNETSEEDLKLLEESEFIRYANGLLSDMKSEILCTPLKEDDDIFRITHHKLKNKMENYKLFYTVLLVYSMENELNYIDHYRQKRFIDYGGERLIYCRKSIGELA